MNELGQTIIENYNTFAPKNMFSEWLKNLLQPLATLSLGFFVYKYTDNRHKKHTKISYEEIYDDRFFHSYFL
ncbi:hypothetical protein LLE89_11315 [Staphylococcus epidermidis]|uniref:hypothetical protein n=1 Tax=Staphylococcus epidermidis TaxID=1282 RepID=UPI001E4DEE07|nr:hypothetical protein [Staphylococcus epidermidis]MCC3754212.1 hypothetical protein [Staphylococcus epidermidis]